jgi:hypothetical protein
MIIKFNFPLPRNVTTEEIHPLLCGLFKIFLESCRPLMIIVKIFLLYGTFNDTPDYTLYKLKRSYFMSISANIELQVVSITCC